MANRPPASLNPKQRYIAELLAIGMTVQEVSKKADVSVSYLNVLLKGSLFTQEIDYARDRLIRKELKSFRRAVAKELIPNVKKLVELRDSCPIPQVQLKAVEVMLNKLVATPKDEEESTKATVKVVLTDERAATVQAVMTEAIDLPALKDARDYSQEE